MTTLNRRHIQKFYNEKTQFSQNIAKKCKAVMNSALKYALEKKFISSNVALDVNLLRCVKKKKYITLLIDTNKTFNEEQVKLLIEKSKDTPIYLQILFAVLMGLIKQGNNF